MNSRNISQLVAVCGLVTMSMTACHPALRGEASLSIDEQGAPLIGVCHEMSVTEARITVRDKDDELLARVRGFGHQVIKEGDFLRVTSGSGGIVFDSFDKAVLAPGNLVNVYVYETPGESGETVSASLWIPEEGLKEGVWLFADGSTWDSACGAYDAQRR